MPKRNTDDRPVEILSSIGRIFPLLFFLAMQSGCATFSTQANFKYKDLYNWDKGDISKVTHTIEIDCLGVPVRQSEKSIVNAEFLQNIQNIKLIISPDCPIEKVAMITQLFRDKQRLEFSTQYGIYIVGAANCGGRRLPSFNKKQTHDVNLTVVVDKNVYKLFIGNKIQLHPRDNIKNLIDTIFDILNSPENNGYKNISVIFQPYEKWKRAELIMALILQRIDRFRGFLLVFQNDGRVLMAFDTVEKNK